MSRGIHRMALRGIRRQSGVSLVIVLVLLVAMSLLGIAILRSTAMQERMSANLRDRSLAFQATEAAIRFAQNEVLGGGAWDITVPTPADCTNLSICPANTVVADNDPIWRNVPGASFNSAAAGLGAAPQYWIEFLGLGPGRKGACDQLPPTLDCFSPMYRITARSRSAGRADVVLQSTVISRIPEPGT